MYTDEIELIQFTDDNDKLVTYHGFLFAPLQGPKETLYGKKVFEMNYH
jgi:hypothetical protein